MEQVAFEVISAPIDGFSDRFRSIPEPGHLPSAV